jgi:ABC-type transporter Mla subunit MlaD
MTEKADEGFGALAQAWSDSLQRLLAEQADSGRAALEALSSTLEATEKALASQEEANRALRKSLEAYREVIGRASATQERSARLIQTALESFAATTQAQLELTRAVLAPLGAQPEAFTSLVQGWNDAFLRLLEATPGAPPKRPRRS